MQGILYGQQLGEEWGVEEIDEAGQVLIYGIDVSSTARRPVTMELVLDTLQKLQGITGI